MIRQKYTRLASMLLSGTRVWKNLSNLYLMNFPLHDKGTMSRYDAYVAWTTQNHACFICNESIHAQEILEECISEGRIMCQCCFFAPYADRILRSWKHYKSKKNKLTVLLKLYVRYQNGVNTVDLKSQSVVDILDQMSDNTLREFSDLLRQSMFNNCTRDALGTRILSVLDDTGTSADSATQLTTPKFIEH